jgi:hypothetical protein
MFILRDALPADNSASGGEGTGTAEAHKPVGFKDAAKDYLEKNPMPEADEATVTESDQEEVDPAKKVEKEVKEEKKEPEFDPLKDEESDSADGDEITEIGVLNEKGEFEKRKFTDVLEDAQFTLKFDKKLYTVNGYEKLKNLAQQGLNSTKINTEAKRVFAENQQLKAGFQQAVEAKALEIANSMYRAQLEEELNPADPTADAGGASTKMLRLLQKQIEDMKTEQTQRFQREEQERQRLAQEQSKQHWANEAKEIERKTLEPFKPYFKDASGKHDEAAFQKFNRDARVETAEALEQMIAEGHEQVFTPEEVGQVLLRVSRKVYKDWDSLIERRYQAKVQLKKKGSGAAALTPGGAGVDTNPLKRGEKVTFRGIKQGKFG